MDRVPPCWRQCWDAGFASPGEIDATPLDVGGFGSTQAVTRLVDANESATLRNHLQGLYRTSATQIALRIGEQTREVLGHDNLAPDDSRAVSLQPVAVGRMTAAGHDEDEVVS